MIRSVSRNTAISESCWRLSPISFQRLLNRIQKILVAKWLGEKLQGSRLHGPYRHRDVAMRGDENNWNLNIGFGEVVLQVEPAGSRQPDIEDEATGHVRKLLARNS